MKKILFVAPTLISETPMTLAMLSAVAKEEGWQTSSCVNTFKKPLDVLDFVSAAYDFKADIVAINMLTFRILFVYDIIKALKASGFTVVVGGPHPTDCPEECWNAGADIVVVGEGEEQMRKICRDPSIRGIMDRHAPLDLATLPRLDLDVFDPDLFETEDGLLKGFHRIYTSRGCPAICTFCDWQVFKQHLRTYPIKKIVDEMKFRKEEYGITSFGIADDCFPLDKKRVFEFCELVAPLDIKWRFNSRANLVNAELLKAAYDSGCFSVAFGLESGSPDTLKRIKKGVLLRQNISAPWLAHEAGLQVYGCMMSGFPWETASHIQENIDFIKKTWDAVTLFQVSGTVMPFPGTTIYKEYSKEYGFENYWLRPDYQKYGIQIYQNRANPLAVSTFYQRYLFDDTYVQDDVFFKYSPEYKQAVKKLVLTIGKHNLEWMLKDHPLKQKIFMKLAKLSMFGFEHFPKLEKTVGGKLFDIFNKEGHRSNIENLRDKRRGIVKNKSGVDHG